MSEVSAQDQSSVPAPHRGYEPGVFNYLRWLYTRFNGRARLREMWFGHIGLIVVMLVITLAAVFSSGVEIPGGEEAEAQGSSTIDLFVAADAPFWLPIVGLGIIAAMIFFPAALAVKRLHDRGKSAWWLAFFWGVPFLLGVLQEIVSAAMGTDVESSVRGDDPSLVVILLGAAAGLIGFWWFIELWLVPGTKGPNRYGIDVRQIPPKFPQYGPPPGTSPPTASD